jgi:hypothetical protein
MKYAVQIALGGPIYIRYYEDLFRPSEVVSRDTHTNIDKHTETAR